MSNAENGGHNLFSIACLVYLCQCISHKQKKDYDYDLLMLILHTECYIPIIYFILTLVIKNMSCTTYYYKYFIYTLAVFEADACISQHLCLSSANNLLPFHDIVRFQQICLHETFKYFNLLKQGTCVEYT